MTNIKRHVLFYPFEYRLYDENNRLILINDQIYYADFIERPYNEFSMYMVKKHKGPIVKKYMHQYDEKYKPSKGPLYTHGRYMIGNTKDHIGAAANHTENPKVSEQLKSNIQRDPTNVNNVIIAEQIIKRKKGKIYLQSYLIARSGSQYDSEGPLDKEWLIVDNSRAINKLQLKLMNIICRESKSPV